MARPRKYGDADDADAIDSIVRDREREVRSSRRTADVSGWSDHTPTGLREGINREEAAELAYRERQTQLVSQQDRVIRKFEHAQFVAHISDRISFTKNGDMMIQLQIPFQFKHLAEPLTDAFGIPLSFDVEVWAPYREASE